MSELRKPSPLDLKKASEWPAWIKQFENYRSTTALNKKSGEVQVRELLKTMGPKSYDVITTFGLTKEDTTSYEIVKQYFDSYFDNGRSGVYESDSCRSHERGEESADQSATGSGAAADHSAFGNTKESVIQDKFVVGLPDKQPCNPLQIDHKVTPETPQTNDRSKVKARKQEQSFREEGSQSWSSPEIGYQGAGVNFMGQKRPQHNSRQCSNGDGDDQPDKACPPKALKCANCGSKVYFPDGWPKEDKSAQQKEPETAASTTIEGEDGLASQIEDALPDITETSLKLLMQSFADLGVKSREDALRLAEPHVLVDILGLDQAKKLVAHLNKHSTSMGCVVTDGGWDLNHRSSQVNSQFTGPLSQWCLAQLQALVNAEPRIAAACRATTESWNKGHEKRQTIMEDTMRSVDEKLTQADRIGENTINGIETSLSRATKAHEEMLQDLREEETRFAKAMEQKRETRKREEDEERERRRLREERTGFISTCINAVTGRRTHNW